MKEFAFWEGEPGVSWKRDFEPSLFNTATHRQFQSPGNWHSFFVADSAHVVCGSAHFLLAEGVAQSPGRAPFACMDFSPSMLPETLFEFLRFVESKIAAHGAGEIVIRAAPANYRPFVPLLSTFLINQGYSVCAAEIASVFDIAGPSVEPLLHRSEKRRHSKARDAGLVFRQVTEDEFVTIFQFIQMCRAEKDFTMSMTIEELSAAVSQFPGRYVLFGVFDRTTLVAAAVCVRVYDDVLYDFYHDHSKDSDHLSPVVMLVDGIHQYCFANNIRLLDLGTSSVDGQPNFGLLRFKMRLGARPVPKYIFKKKLA